MNPTFVLENTYYVNAILLSAAGLNLIAGILFACRRETMGWLAFSLGCLVAAGIIGINALTVRDIPLGNMYQVQVVLALMFLPLALLLRLRERLSTHLVWFALAAALPLIGACFLEKDAGWKRMPALQSAWFAPHVLAYMIGYALATVAALMQVGNVIARSSLWQVLIQPSKQESPEEKIIPSLLRLAFPFLIFGLLSGCLWADQAWGRFWSWDPKETWSLITVTLYLCYFHLRSLKASERWRIICHLTAFLALLTTFFVVNLLPKLASALHSYAK